MRLLFLLKIARFIPYLLHRQLLELRCEAKSVCGRASSSM